MALQESRKRTTPAAIGENGEFGRVVWRSAILVVRFLAKKRPFGGENRHF
jgi:hypothetical protein